MAPFRGSFVVSLCPYAKEAGESNPHFLDFFRKVCENLFQAVTDSRLGHTLSCCDVHVGHIKIELFNNGILLFVRQFRYPYNRVLLELPAGKLEKGEDPLSAGMRELEEECGVTAKSVVPMGEVYPTVAYCTEIIHLFLARGLKKTSQHLDEGEFLSVEEIPLKDAVKLVMDGEIADSKTVALVLKTEKLLSEGRI